MNPVREALDYYRKLNEAGSKENRCRRSASVDADGPPLPPADQSAAAGADTSDESSDADDLTPVVLLKNERNGSLSTLIETLSISERLVRG